MRMQYLLLLFTTLLHDFMVCRHYIDGKKIENFELASVIMLLLMFVQAIAIAVHLILE